MPLITEKKQVLDLYKNAIDKKWVIPCFCTENLTTTESVLSSIKEYGEEIGENNLPVIIAITNLYPNRSQSVNYTNTGVWVIGLKLFLADLRILISTDSPYKDLNVMVHLDHIQHDLDKELLNWDLTQFSSIMYDASNLPLEKNMELTKKFIKNTDNSIVVEGACDEILDASNGIEINNVLTSPDNAKKFIDETRANFIVANLGTEHRSSSSDLRYYGNQARKIKEKVGQKIVLHGASSVPTSQIKTLHEDGICKINIWTILERDSSPELFINMIKNAAKITGEKITNELKENGYLGNNINSNEKQSLQYYTTKYRQEIIFKKMKDIVKSYLKICFKKVKD